MHIILLHIITRKKKSRASDLHLRWWLCCLTKEPCLLIHSLVGKWHKNHGAKVLTSSIINSTFIQTQKARSAFLNQCILNAYMSTVITLFLRGNAFKWQLFSQNLSLNYFFQYEDFFHWNIITWWVANVRSFLDHSHMQCTWRLLWWVL